MAQKRPILNGGTLVDATLIHSSKPKRKKMRLKQYLPIQAICHNKEKEI